MHFTSCRIRARWGAPGILMTPSPFKYRDKSLSRVIALNRLNRRLLISKPLFTTSRQPHVAGLTQEIACS